MIQKDELRWINSDGNEWQPYPEINSKIYKLREKYQSSLFSKANIGKLIEIVKYVTYNSIEQKEINRYLFHVNINYNHSSKSDWEFLGYIYPEVYYICNFHTPLTAVFDVWVDNWEVEDNIRMLTTVGKEIVDGIIRLKT